MKENNLKYILSLAFPIALQQLLTASLHLIDTAMVVSLGDIAIAAVGISGRWFFFINITLFGFASGMSVFASQYWGANDKANIHKAYGMGLVSSLAAGFIFCAAAVLFPEALIKVFTPETAVIEAGAEYIRIASLSLLAGGFNSIASSLLRSTENVKLPLIASFASVVTNTVLNYILINGKLGFPVLGVRGAAIATAISAFIYTIILLAVSYKKKNIAAVKFIDIKPESWGYAKDFFKIAMPVLLNEMFWALGTNIYSMVLSRQGSSNYAAFTIFSSVDQLSFTFFIGLISACAVIVGKQIGRGDIREGYITAKKFMIYTPLAAMVVSALLIIFRNPLLGLLNIPNESTKNLASQLLLIYSFILPFRMVSYVAVVGIFRAGGDTKAGLFLDLFNVYLMGVPAIIIAAFVLHLPFIYVFLAMFAEDVIKVPMCFIYFFRKKWIRKLT